MDEVIAEIRTERLRQIYEEGFGPQHDDAHRAGELRLERAETVHGD